MLYQRPNSPYWWSRISHPSLPDGKARRSTGIPIEDSAGKHSREELRQRAQKEEDQFKASLWDRPLSGEHTFYEACAEWLESKTKRGRTRSRSATNALKKLLGREDDAGNKKAVGTESYPDRPLSEATAKSFDFFLSNLSDAYYNWYLGILSGIFRIAAEKEWIVLGPKYKFKWKHIPKGPKRRALYDEDEWQALLTSFNPRSQHVLQMVRYAKAEGVRPHNYTHLKWTDLDFQPGREWAALYIDGEDTKTGQDLVRKLTDESVKILNEQWGQHPVWVFPFRGAPVKSFKTAWNKACKRAGIENLTPYGLRHTWASTMLMNNVPPKVVQLFGCWKTSDMVDNYFHPAPDYLNQFVNASATINTRNKKAQLKKKHTGGAHRTKKAA